MNLSIYSKSFVLRLKSVLLKNEQVMPYLNQTGLFSALIFLCHNRKKMKKNDIFLIFRPPRAVQRMLNRIYSWAMRQSGRGGELRRLG